MGHEHVIGVRAYALKFTLFRLFAVYLYDKGRYLWPIVRFKKEVSWCAFSRKVFRPFDQPLQMFDISQKEKGGIYDCGIRLFRTLRWRSINDITDEDVSRIRERLRKADGCENMGAALYRVVGAAIDRGADLTYLTSRELSGRTLNKGRTDGSFAWLDDKFFYWKERFRDYVLDKHRCGLQAISAVCGKLNSWADYLCLLETKGACPGSLNDVVRSVHIEYRPSAHPHFPSFTEWLQVSGASAAKQASIINRTKAFFDYVIKKDFLNLRNPILDVDVPGYRPSIKSHRSALSLNWWLGLLHMLFDDPPPHFERVRDGKEAVLKESPSLSTYVLIRLIYGIRHHQAAFLDKDTLLHPDGILINGDKNPNRDYLQIAPHIDERLKARIEECRQWQERYNYPPQPVWYNGHNNSPYGKVRPIFRPIGRSGKPFGRRSCDYYMKRVFLKYQKKASIPAEEHIVVGQDGKPLDLSSINPDTMRPKDIESKCFSLFDLHSLRVTAATIWYEQGIPLEVIADFLTGHATIAMLNRYVKYRNAQQLMQERYQAMMEKKNLERELKTEPESAIEKFFLTSRVYREDDQDLNGIKSLKETAIAFWRFFNYGICPTGACLAGLADRCCLCPMFITGPVYKNDIAAQINLVLERIAVCISEIKNSRMRPEQRQAELEELLQVMTGWYGWYGYLERQERQREEGGAKRPALFTQTLYEPRRASLSMLELQRCVDIALIPEVYSEHAYHVARERLERFLSNTQPDVSVHDVLRSLTKGEVIEKTARYFLHLIESKISEDEIEMLFSTVPGNILPDYLGEPLTVIEHPSLESGATALNAEIEG